MDAFPSAIVTLSHFTDKAMWALIRASSTSQKASDSSDKEDGIAAESDNEMNVSLDSWGLLSTVPLLQWCWYQF